MLMTGISTPSRSGAIRWKTVLLAMALLTWNAAASAEQPSLLYGAATGLTTTGANILGIGPSTLYTIDPVSGAASPVGPIQDPAFPGQLENVTGLAVLGDGTLVGSAIGDDLASCAGTFCSVLVEIDPTNGAALILGEIGDDSVAGQCGRTADLTFDQTTQTLYGYVASCNGGGEGLAVINPNGAEPLGTLVGNSGFTGDGRGLASEPATGALFATPGLQFISLNAATGAGTSVGPLTTLIDGLAFDPQTGVLYGANRRGNSTALPANNNRDWFLVTIDPATGVVTELGPVGSPLKITLGGPPLDGVEALTFQAPAGCPWLPLGSCTDAQRASLDLRARYGQLKLDLQELGATSKAEFGDPLEETRYAVCLYLSTGEDDPTFAGGYAVPPGANWHEGSKGFRFKSRLGDTDGIRSVKLSEGAAGKAKVTVKGEVTIPELPLPSDSVLAQVVNDIGSCFGATVEATQNDAVKYKGSTSTAP